MALDISKKKLVVLDLVLSVIFISARTHFGEPLFPRRRSRLVNLLGDGCLSLFCRAEEGFKVERIDE